MQGSQGNSRSSNENRSPPVKVRTTMKKVLDPWGPYVPMWNTIFLISFVISVSIDPLLLYIPVIDKDKMCLSTDTTLKIIAPLLRCVSDLSYLVNISFKIRTGLMQRNGLIDNTYWQVARRIYWPSILLDVLAILPLPQVLLVAYFSKMWSWRSFFSTKFISFFVLIQYIPRVLRVYLSCEKLKRTPRVHSRTVWFKIKVVLIFLLYVVASHAVGAVWYFYSIQREMACWHHVCEQHAVCVPSDFVCQSKYTPVDMNFLYSSCHTNPSGPKTFDYGIFYDASQSGILEMKMSFVTKLVRCYWWGLRSISSFGQNLETSPDVWETAFAASISITAMVLFIYLMGNLQMYMQMATSRSEEIVKRMRWIEEEVDIWVWRRYLPEDERTLVMQDVEHALQHFKDSFNMQSLRSLLLRRLERMNDNLNEDEGEKLEGGLRSEDKTQLGYAIKEQKAEEWMLRNGLPEDQRLKIMPHVRSTLQENEEVNLKTILSVLPRKREMSIKKHLCFSVLKTVPMLRDLDDDGVEIVCNNLKPVIYPEKSYIIRQGEPLDSMFVLTEGIAWTYEARINHGETSAASSASCLEKGDFYGDKELREWTLFNNTSLSNIPIATTNVKAHTNVEALALMAKDLRDLFPSSSRASRGSISPDPRTVQIKVDI